MTNRFKGELRKLIAVMASVAMIFSTTPGGSLISPHAVMASTPQNVRITNVNNAIFSVSWTTDVQEKGYVKYSTDPAFSTSATLEDDRGADTVSSTHHVTVGRVSGLSPNTPYYFKIGSGTADTDFDATVRDVTTGPDIGASPVIDDAFGKVKKSDGSWAEGTIVYVTVSDNNLTGSSGTSAPLSGLVGTDGFWSVDLGSSRTQNYQNFFTYSLSGDTTDAFAEGGLDGTANISVDTANDTPVSTLTLTPPDTTGPTTSSVSASPSVTNGSAPVVLTANVDDSGNSNIAAAEYFIDTIGTDGSGTSMNATDGSFNTPTEGVTASVDVSALTAGTYTLYVHGKDAKDNWGGTASTTITIDKTAPTVSSVIPHEGATGVATTAVVKATFSEDMDSFTISSNFLLQEGTTPVAGSVSYDYGIRTATLTPSASLKTDTTYTATITTGVSDVAGNFLAAPKVWNFTTTDTIVPTTTLTPDPISPNGAGGWYRTAPTISLSISEPGTSYYQWDSTSGTWTTYGLPFKALEGTHTLYYYSRDTAGNDEAPPKSQLFKVDTGAPASSITSPTEGLRISGTSYGITGTSSDPASSGVSKVEVSINDGLWQLAVGTPSWSYTWTLPADGFYNIKSRATDNAGNVEIPGAGVTVTVDKTAPTVTSTSPSNGASDVPLNTTVSAVFSEDMDAGTINTSSFFLHDGVTNVVGDVSYAGGTATFTPSSSLKSSTTYTATIAIAVKDLAGNSLAAPKVWSFTTKDAVAPVITNATGGTTADIGAAETISADVTDDVGVASVTLRYHQIGSAVYSTLSMSKLTGDTYTATIPASDVTATDILYYIEAVDTSGNSSTAPMDAPLSEYLITTEDLSAPSAPTGLTVTGVAYNSVSLSWTASTDNVGVAGYKVERSTDGSTFGQIADVSSTSYSDTTVAPSTTYYYRVRAYDAAAHNSGYSNTVNATTLAEPDTTKPVISNTTGNTTGSTTAEIGVAKTITTDVTDNVTVSEVKLFYRNVGDISFTSIVMTNVGGATYSGTISAGAITSADIQYYVYAKDSSSNEQTDPAGAPDLDTYLITTNDTTPPSAPGSLTAQAISYNRIDLSWTASTDNDAVAGYEIRRSLNGTDFTYYANVVGGAVTSYSDTNVVAATHYYYQVAAHDSEFNYSGYSNTAEATTPAGPLTRLTISPTSAILTPGGTQAFTAHGYDEWENEITTLTFNWTKTGGSLSAATGQTVTYTAGTTAGSYYVEVASGGKTARADITINPGALDHLGIQPLSATLAIGGTQDFTARGYDAWNNEITGLTFNWTAIGGSLSAVIGQTVTYTAGTTAGNYSVDVSSGSKNANAAITINPGALDHIVVTPDTTTLKPTQTQNFTATAYDVYNNVISGVSFAWSATAGSVTPASGASTTYTAPTTPGSYTVTAEADTKSGSASITVTVGDLDRITITPSSATLDPLGTQEFSAKGYDAWNNEISGLTFNWSQTGGSLSAATGQTVTYTAGTAAGSFYVEVTSGTVSKQASVTINPGPVTRVSVSPSSVTLTPTQTQTFTAQAYDQWNNPVTTSYSWTQQGGSLDTTTGSSVVYTAGITPSSGSVTATAEGISGSASITIEPGPIYRIDVTPSSVTLTVGDTQVFTAEAFDQWDNSVSTTFSWTSSGGSLNTTSGASVTYTAGILAGPGSVTATADSVPGSASITITPGALDHVTINPPTATLTPGATESFTAQGYDLYNNEITGLMYSWKATGGLLSSTTESTVTYTAGSTAGSYTVTVTSGTKSDSVSVTIQPGSLGEVRISPTTANLDPGEQRTFSAQAYDSDGNPIPGASFTWSTTGGGTLSATSGSSVTYTAGSDAGNWQVTVQSNSYSDIAQVTVNDVEPPVISGVTGNTTATIGSDKIIVATVTDNMAVQSVVLHYRTIGDLIFESINMSGAGSTYSATIPAGQIGVTDLEYYIEATDTSANAATNPALAPAGSYYIVTTALAAPANVAASDTPNDEGGSISVSWSSVASAEGYRVYWGTASGVYGSPATTATASYELTGLTNGTTYFVAVKAYAGSKESAYSAEVSATPWATIQGTVGGTVAIEGEAEIAIEADSFSGSQTITIIRVDSPPPDPAGTAGRESVVYDFGPEGLTFDPPATLTINYDPSADPALIDIYMYDGSFWTKVTEGRTVDTIAHTISVKVSHFTEFGVFSQSKPVPPPPEPPKAEPAPPSQSGGPPATPPQPATPHPPAYGHLRGRVISQSGNPITGTVVRAGGLVVPTEPLTGEFRIANLPTGVYTVYYDAPGYISQTQEAIAIYSEMTTYAPTVIMTSETVPAVAGQVVSGIQFLPATIIGKVVDLRGRPIRNATVRIDGTVLKTNRKGYFRFTQVVPGTYIAHYNAKGYAGQTQVLDVKSGENVPPKVIMKRPGLRLAKVSRKIRQQIGAVTALPRTVMRTVEKYRKIMAETLNRMGRPDLVGKVDVTDS